MGIGIFEAGVLNAVSGSGAWHWRRIWRRAAGHQVLKKWLTGMRQMRRRWVEEREWDERMVEVRGELEP